MFASGEQKAVSLVSIVVPAYNEADVILEFNRRLSAVRRELSVPSEVIFVNDGSTDNTFGLLRALKATDPTIGIVDLSRNLGKEIALTAGLDHARGDAVVVIDADLQHPPGSSSPSSSRGGGRTTSMSYTGSAQRERARAT